MSNTPKSLKDAMVNLSQHANEGDLVQTSLLGKMDLADQIDFCCRLKARGLLLNPKAVTRSGRTFFLVETK